MRRTSITLLAGMVIGVLLASALPTLAANGDPIYLGQKNTARRVTIVRVKNGTVFEATKANTPAATFKVASGAPFAVESTAWIDKLNADMLDGRHSYNMLVTYEFASNDNLPDEVNWTEDLYVTVPSGGGAVVMNAGVGYFNNTGGDYEAGCRFKVDGVVVSGSFRADETTHGQSATCTSEALKMLPQGSHTITFTTFAMTQTGIQLNEGFFYVMVLPN